MIKRLATRRKCSTFWHKPIRGKGLCCYVDANNDGYLADNERVSQFDYKLDHLGQKTDALEQFWAEYNVGVDPLVNHILWTYDSLGRLTSEVFDHYDNAFDQTQEWEYDLVGNRLVQKLDKGNDGIYEAITTYTYDANDRLITELFDDLTEADKDKETLYGYTHTQQTSKTVSEKTDGKFVKQSETTFEYDLQGRMSVVTITAGGRVERTVYEYGADGIRVSAEHTVSENGSVISHTKTEYLNDSQNITGYSQVLKQTETDIVSGEEKITTYVIGHQRISQTVKENNETKEYYFTFDGHGSTRVLLNTSAAVAQIYSFDAYGNALGFNTGEALTEFLYSGEQFDSKIGQQYLRARYYDPSTGRFNRLDPFFGNLNDPQSLHKYLYTHSNPINGIDPTGNMSVGMVCAIGIGMSIGYTLGGFTGAFKGAAFAVGLFTNPIMTLVLGGWEIFSPANWNRSPDRNKMWDLLTAAEVQYDANNFWMLTPNTFKRPSQMFTDLRWGDGEKHPRNYYFGACDITRAFGKHSLIVRTKGEIIELLSQGNLPPIVKDRWYSVSQSNILNDFFIGGMDILGSFLPFVASDEHEALLLESFLGSFAYGYEVNPNSVDWQARTATVRFKAANIAGLQSLTRIPWTRDSSIFGDYSTGPWATTSQFFMWDEVVQF